MLRPFIDAHVHLNTNSKAKWEMAKIWGAHFLSINTEIPFFISLDEQENVIHELNTEQERASFITSFSTEQINQDDWLEKTIKRIKDSIERGAKGVKIWKNIGMDPNLKDSDGEFIMIDDERFVPLFKFMEDHNILVIGHQGEPRNCWLPVADMTVDSDKDYFSAHPEYHMYKNPEYPTYERQMEARDQVLRRHPNLRYVGLHLFSLEYDLKEVAKRLDEFPNSMTDLAERICHVQLQAMENRDEVRDFFIKYQDRIIYGTDVIDDGSMTEREVVIKFENLWKQHWRFFASKEAMQAKEFKGTFYGLELPQQVLENLFRENAKRVYSITHINN